MASIEIEGAADVELDETTRQEISNIEAQLAKSPTPQNASEQTDDVELDEEALKRYNDRLKKNLFSLKCEWA